MAALTQAVILARKVKFSRRTWNRPLFSSLFPLKIGLKQVEQDVMCAPKIATDLEELQEIRAAHSQDDFVRPDVLRPSSQRDVREGVVVEKGG